MGRVMLTLLLCAVAIPAAAPSAANSGDSPEIVPIALFLDFEQRPSDAVLSQAKQQVEIILQPTGLRFEWRMLAQARLGEDFADLAVIRFKGACEPASGPIHDAPDTRTRRAALASTQISDGQMLSFSQVECNTLREYLASTGRTLNPGQLDDQFARALGRVMAHELFHIFTGRTRHSAKGVARAFYSRIDLLQDDFSLEPRDSAAIAESQAESHR
jgi:hypothetical protein